MENDKDYTDLIDRFFDDELSDMELEGFDSKVREDPAFAARVALEHSIRKGAAQLRSEQADQAYAAYRKKMLWQKSILALASVALLFCLWHFLVKPFFFPTPQHNSSWPVEQQQGETPAPETPDNPQEEPAPAKQPNDTLPEKVEKPVAKPPQADKKPPALIANADFRPFLQPYSSDRIQKSGGSGTSLYRAGDYAAALPQLEKDYASAPTSFEQAELGIYIGSCLVFLEKYPQAVQYLETLEKDRNAIRLRKDARWYLALAYLGNGEEKEAINLLQLLVSDMDYGESARGLLEKIKG
ncbi:MAG: hypothetical protein H6577_19875 [Lewinellaceae bacterium]|nr:hypothetical protein [Lewinellaceae bacterium]